MSSRDPSSRFISSRRIRPLHCRSPIWLGHWPVWFYIGSAGNLIREYGKLNWAPFVLGIVIVGLEVGWIYAYKAGWQVSTGFIVQSAFLAAALLLVGYVLYHESLSWNKIVGVMICLIGLGFINYK